MLRSGLFSILFSIVYITTASYDALTEISITGSNGGNGSIVINEHGNMTNACVRNATYVINC